MNRLDLADRLEKAAAHGAIDFLKAMVQKPRQFIRSQAIKGGKQAYKRTMKHSPLLGRAGRGSEKSYENLHSRLKRSIRGNVMLGHNKAEMDALKFLKRNKKKLKRAREKAILGIGIGGTVIGVTGLAAHAIHSNPTTE